MKVSSKESTISKLLRGSLVAAALLPAAAQAQTVPNVTYQGPITISAGGTYTGNYRSTDSSVPAVTINTSAPVILQGCVIVGAGDLIQANGVPGDITVLNSQAYGTTPTQDNRYRGRFIAATKARNIRAENNYLEHTTGFTIYQFSGDGSANQTVRIMRNRVLDIDGRTRNGGVQLANFIGLNTVRNIANIEIGWNQVINEPNQSSVEDNINFYNSGGTQQNPALVHDNYVQGAYPYPATGSTFSGTGMTTDGDATTVATVSSFVKAYNNQFISTCNAGMNIAAGHDISYYNNRIVTSALLPDGTALKAVYAGTAVFNGHQVASSVFYNNTIQNNTIGYRSPGYSSPYTDRQDLSNGACATCTGTTHLPNPITLATEQNELTLWQQKLTQNNVAVGVGGSVGGIANTPPTVSLSAPTNGTVGAALTLTATAAVANGTVSKVEFLSGSTVLGEASAAPFTFSYTPTAAGTLSLTARATNNAGATTTSAAISVSVAASATTTGPANFSFYRAIDLGGTASTIDGRAWEATTASGFSTNAPSWANQASVLNPATDASRAAMLRSALYGTGPTLALSVPNGTYAVYLYIWENDNPETINIQLEGQTVRTGYNTGSAGHWERVGPFTSAVTDGVINVATTGGNVNLSGLEVWKSNGATAAPTTGTAFYRAIDLGSSTATTIDGRAWEATTASGFSTNAPSWANQSAVLNPTTDASRATMLRSALYGTGPTLALSVPNGSYEVYLHIWEDNSPETISIAVEGQTVRTGYNTGSAGHWERVGPFAANVTDGVINVATSGGNVNLSGLEVWKVNGTASLNLRPSPRHGAGFDALPILIDGASPASGSLPTASAKAAPLSPVRRERLPLDNDRRFGSYAVASTQPEVAG